jgi:hypothetical protein
MNTDRVAGDGATTRLPVRCKDGSRVAVAARFFYLRGDGERILGAVAVLAPLA